MYLHCVLVEYVIYPARIFYVKSNLAKNIFKRRFYVISKITFFIKHLKICKKAQGNPIVNLKSFEKNLLYQFQSIYTFTPIFVYAKRF